MVEAAWMSAIQIKHNKPPCTPQQTEYGFNKVTCCTGREGEKAVNGASTEGEHLITHGIPRIPKCMPDIYIYLEIVLCLTLSGVTEESCDVSTALFYPLMLFSGRLEEVV